MPVPDLLRDHPGPWDRATRHPFLLGVRDGTVAPGAFDTWLVQDHRFVADLLRFQARLLARAPRPAQAVLAGGAVALVAELDWFEQLAARRGLDLDVPRLPATAAYADLLERLDGADVPSALTALWAIERVYLDAWTVAAPGAPEYAGYVAHWTTPAFAAYVDDLAAAAAALGGRHDDVVLEVLEAEVAFWTMASENVAPDAPMSLARRLWADSADLAEATLAHPFIRGLGDGSLPRERFAGYVAQDAFFLQAFARGYAMAVVRSPDRGGLEAFADLLAGVRDELRLHDGYAARWGIDLAVVEPAPATSAYTDFLLATAATGGLGETCAALTPCMRLYAHLGQSLAGRSGEFHEGPFAEWVTAYADPGFEGLAATLEELLDRYAADTPAVARTYRRAMELEVAFFEAAWRG